MYSVQRMQDKSIANRQRRCFLYW